MAGLARIFNNREVNQARRGWFHRWPHWPVLQSMSPSANADVIAQFGIEAKAQAAAYRAW
jgi:hypothetical protein